MFRDFEMTGFQWYFGANISRGRKAAWSRSRGEEEVTSFSALTRLRTTMEFSRDLVFFLCAIAVVVSTFFLLLFFPSFVLSISVSLWLIFTVQDGSPSKIYLSVCVCLFFFFYSCPDFLLVYLLNTRPYNEASASFIKDDKSWIF